MGPVGLVIAVDSLNNFTFVHASTPKTGVRIDHSDRPGYANTFVGARRIVACSENNFTLPVQTFENNVVENTNNIVQNENSTPNTTSKKKAYIVKQGDTLYGISKKYKISVEKIQKANKLKTDKIYPGQKLIIK
jgi:LysM repeat protein